MCRRRGAHQGLQVKTMGMTCKRGAWKLSLFNCPSCIHQSLVSVSFFLWAVSCMCPVRIAQLFLEIDTWFNAFCWIGALMLNRL